MKFMDRNPNVAMIGVGYHICLGNSLISRLDNMIRMATYFKYGRKESSPLPGTGASVCRVKALRQVGGFDENLKKSAEDIDVAFRLRAAGWSLCLNSTIIYQKDCIRTWKRLWNRHFKSGYALHYTCHKDKGIFALYARTPLPSFIEGLLLFSTIYKLTGRKMAILLPLFLTFIRTALCFAYIKSHIDGYGHS